MFWLVMSLILILILIVFYLATTTIRNIIELDRILNFNELLDRF